MRKYVQARFQRGCSLYLLILILFFLPHVGKGMDQSQNVDKVSGVVTDEDGEPLVGVSIGIKNTGRGTITTLDGAFNIEAKVGEVLVFSYLGFKTEEIQVTSLNQVINLNMSSDLQKLEEVVVIGYGTQKKKELTGSVATLSEEDLIDGNVNNPLQFLQGKVAGLNVVKSGRGDPNGGFQVQLRGLTTLAAGQEPLVVIDGVIGGSLSNIAMDEIESIDVLKDGSAAAIYGTRGTNGVILITTKRAARGDLKVGLNSYVGVQNITRELEVLDANEYRFVINNYFPNSTDLDYGESTDWLGEVTDENALSQYYHLSATGGNDNLQYRASINWQEQNGAIKKTSNSRVRSVLNVTQHGFNDRLSINYNLSYSSGKNRYADYYILEQTTRRNPTEPVFEEENKSLESGPYYFVDAFQYYNPVAMQNEDTDEGELRNFMGSIKANYRIFDDLSFTMQGSIIDASERRGQYLGRYHPIDFSLEGRATITNSISRSRVLEANFDYQKQFLKKHNVAAIAGYSYNDGEFEFYNMSNYGFDTDLFSYNNIGVGSALEVGDADISSFKESNKLIAFFGRIQYNFDQKYFLSASLRHEGSSRFGKNNKWGNFPAVSAGWIISNEGFMQNLSFVDNLKLRAGFGVTGNQAIPNYQSLQLLRPGGRFFYQGEWVNTYRPANNDNPNLKWERKEEINIGLDASILKNRVGLTLDFYQRTTKDLLYTYTVPVPPFLYNQFFTNVGTIENRGLEVALQLVPVVNDKITWTTNLVYSRNTNKLLSFSNEEFAILDIRTGYLSERFQQFTQRIVEGGPIGNFWRPKFLGTNETGENVFEDVNNDGKVNDLDDQVIGNALPDFTFGFTNTIRGFGFDFSILLRGSVGNDILNVHRLYYEGLSNFGTTNVLRTSLDDPEYRAPSVYSSRYIEDGSFVKIDNITLGYTFPIKKTTVQNMRLYVTGQNVATFTNYLGVDPEVSINGLEPGIDTRRYYPGTTTILFGLDINF